MGSFEWYYLFPLCLALLVSWGYNKIKVGYIAFFLLLFFNVFRGEGVGNDTANYMSYGHIQHLGSDVDIEVISMDNLSKEVEYTALFFNRIIYNYNLDTRWIITIYSIITFVFLFLAVKRFKSNLAFVCLIYVLLNLFYFSLSAARQMAAVSVLLLAYSYLNREDKWRYMFFLLVGFAATIHISTIFVALLYPFRYMKPERMSLLVITVFLSFFFIVIPINVFPFISQIIDIDYITRYAETSQIDFGRSLLGIVVSIVELACFAHFYILKRKSRKADLWDCLFAFAIILRFMFISTNGLLSRVVYNILIFVCIYISDCFEQNNIRSSKLQVTYVIFLIMHIYTIGNYGARGALINGYYLNF